MVSFSVDQFMQVKCKFQLTSENESSESKHTNDETIRFCTSVDLDKGSSIIVMICSNETGNNHILAYYIERKTFTTNNNQASPTTPPISTPANSLNLPTPTTNLISIEQNNNNIHERIKIPVDLEQSPTYKPKVTFSSSSVLNSNQCSPNKATSNISNFPAKVRPRIIVKQIYYHNYNEDIVAICLNESGSKLALVSASSTIYIIPIKNILFNLHAKQLRSSQGKSMYFYDASIIDCCSISNPISIVFWESVDNCNQTTIIVGGEQGDLSFINLEEKKQVNLTHINEPIKEMKLIRDRFSYSLLITSESFRQYRFVLELIRQQELSQDSIQTSSSNLYDDEYTHLEKDFSPTWGGKPIPIKLHNSNFLSTTTATSVIHRAFTPSIRVSGQTKLISSLHARERSLPLIFYHPTSMLSIVDILGPSSKANSKNSRNTPEPRMIRFYSTRSFYYRPQKPILVCRVTSIDPDEMITHVVLTDRFLAIATNRDRCLLYSRNCCNLKSSSITLDIEPLVKEVAFNGEERILNLSKSPVPNDQDGIIDSFLLVTNRSIYSIEARQNCRDMYINLIDGHLSMRQERFNNAIKSNSNAGESAYIPTPQRKSSEATLLIDSFLNRRDDVYERIIYDSRAFSALYKLELKSLFEAYGDQLLLRDLFGLANDFFKMADFSHAKIVAKYLRLANQRSVDHMRSILENEDFMDEKERIELAQVIFDCQLLSLFRKKASRSILKKLQEHYATGSQTSLGSNKGSETKQISYVALRQFESFRKLVLFKQRYQHDTDQKSLPLNDHRLLMANIFNEFLSASLDESTEDSCRLWFNYINFYLNYVGCLEELECDILQTISSSSGDCRAAITLYKAVGRDEEGSTVKSFIENGIADTPLESMHRLYNLSELFSNEFLMKLLERTLDVCESRA